MKMLAQTTSAIGTGNSRQSGANCDLFHVNHAIPYQQRTAIDFVPIFPNAWLWERAD
jgi:aconitase B